MAEQKFLKDIETGVLLLSISTFIFEISLARIFSLTLWYYFGFLAISIVLFAFGASGLISFYFRKVIEKRIDSLAVASLIAAYSSVLAVVFHIKVNFVGIPFAHFGFYALLLSQFLVFVIPFLFIGVYISSAFMLFGKDNAGKLYFYNLAGSAIGSIAAMTLLYFAPAPDIVFAVAGISSVASFFSAQKRSKLLRRVSIASALVFFLFLFFSFKTNIIHIESVKSYGYESLQTKDYEYDYEGWSPISRVTVLKESNITTTIGGNKIQIYRRIIVNDGGAPARMWRFQRNYTNFGFLKRDPRMAAQELTNGSILIIGSAGGNEVLGSLYYKKTNITAVEINSVTAKIVTEIFADYNGNIFNDKRVDFHVAEGRNFVMMDHNNYDMIMVSVADSWNGVAGGAYMFSENYLYTLDAIESYMERVKEGGYLVITRFLDFDEALRVTNMMLEYMEKNGIQEPDKKIMVLSDKSGSRASVIMRKGENFDEKTLERVSQKFNRNGFKMVYVPFGHGNFDYILAARNIASLIQPSEYAYKDREDFIKQYKMNIEAPTDDKPFFFFTQKSWTYMPYINEHPSRKNAIPTLYLAAILTLSMSVMFIFLNRNKMVIIPAETKLAYIVYNAALGFGFMLIEIPLIQQFILFLGYPAISMAVILSGLLLWMGLGSYATQKFNESHYEKFRVYGFPLLLFFIVSYSLFCYYILMRLLFLPFLWRISISILILMPLGILIGMPFSIGISKLGQKNKEMIPGAWAINGIFSVVGSIFAVVFALNLGFRKTMLISAATYFIAYICFYKMHQEKNRQRVKI
ncbi:hypothetical protein HYW20_06600 [Candidatus Woesearchaeota archaeon]|nr:hypothetical protein [Candidatus Woesearchaeota archaeon]